MERSTAHITAVLRGRPIEHIARALSRLKCGRELAGCAGFASEARRIVRGVCAAISERWCARLSLHIWDRLELSRARMDDLRHLLSFQYDPETDSYMPIRVWQSASDPEVYEDMPRIVGRAGRERLFGTLAGEAQITVGDNGRCERDAGRCCTQMYSRFHRAMRSDFSDDRPARPILYFDGTGGSLGRGICHAEIGSADFSGGVKQSRATVSPLALYQGNDHALPLRRNLTLSMKSFNTLTERGSIVRDDGERIPCEPIVVGDMQGLKCVMGMTESCHSVWCKCRARGGFQGEGVQHNYGEEGADFKTYGEMLAFYDQVGCEFKSEDFLLACAHLSKGLYWGGAFTPFECPECGYKPSAAKAKADLAAFNAMSDEEQKEARRAHVKGGRHWHIELFMGPMPKGLGMRRCGVDNLHLVYLNVFKHLFKYTIHEPLPASKQKLIAHYVREAGFYSYDAADEGDDPVKRWIGREVKRFIHEADQHLPFLLQLASSQIDLTETGGQGAAGQGAAGEQPESMDFSGDEFEPTEEEVAAERASEPLVVANAARWDRFLSWVRGIEEVWVEDSDEYREQRALQYCNGARAVSRDLLALKPTMESWVPHIACNIVPRQIRELGDPTRRSADACESFGAVCKKTIKHLTCRRSITRGFTRGFIEQAFRRLCVRSDRLHGPENAPFLLRQDHVVLGTGRLGSGHATVCGPCHSVRVKVEQEMGN